MMPQATPFEASFEPDRKFGAVDPHRLVLTPTVRRHTLYERWGPRGIAETCPRRVARGPSASSGVVLYRYCRRLNCLFCARLLVDELRQAVVSTKPSALVTFTRLTSCHEINRNRINRTRQYLKRSGYDFAWVWATEENPGRNGYHVHAWLRGDVPGPGILQERATQTGIGLTDIRPVTAMLNPAYVVKAAIWNEGSLRAHLLVNGGRLAQGNRFWRDQESGASCSRRVAAASQRAINRHRPADGFSR